MKKIKTAMLATSMICSVLLQGVAVAADLGHIMALGDSITDGYDVVGGYREPLYQRLTANGHTFTFVGSSTTNSTALLTANGQAHHEGHSGWVIGAGTPSRLASFGGLYQNMERWIGPSGANHPNTILLMIGTNDAIDNYDLPNAGERLGALIDRIFDLEPDVKVLLASIAPSQDAGREGRIRIFNSLLPGVMAAQKAAGHDIHFVDIYSAIDVNTDMNGTHPHLTGYNKMADVWSNAIIETHVVVPDPETSTFGKSILCDFESLTGQPFSASMIGLSGQGGWIDVGSSSADRLMSNQSANFFSGNVTYSYGGGLEVYKKMGSPITTSPDGVLTLRFDLRTGTNRSGQFGIGFHDSGMRLGIKFGCYNTNGWGITDALGIDHTSTSGLVDQQGTRLELNIDLRKGTGSLRYDANDGNGFVGIAKLQDIDLELNAIPGSAANPATWDTFYLSGASPGDMMDNLSSNFTSQPVLKMLGIGLTSPEMMEMEAVFLYTTQMYVLQKSTTMEPGSWTDDGAAFQPTSHTAEAISRPKPSDSSAFFRLKWVGTAP